jgi:uncharacterized membrane protein
MTFIVPYVAALIVFGIIDAGWLDTIGKLLYRPALGDILLDGLRVAPAIVFYFAYPIGIVAFAVMPALRANSLPLAFCAALLFGAPAYGTYDLSNYATLRHRRRRRISLHASALKLLDCAAWIECSRVGRFCALS